MQFSQIADDWQLTAAWAIRRYWRPTRRDPSPRITMRITMT